MTPEEGCWGIRRDCLALQGLDELTQAPSGAVAVPVVCAHHDTYQRLSLSCRRHCTLRQLRVHLTAEAYLCWRSDCAAQ